jgi:branched-chain amino acid transport system ATP-binding protein
MGPRSLVLVEQYVSRALAIADHVYILDRGRISFSGSPASIAESEIMNRYLGAGTSQPLG